MNQYLNILVTILSLSIGGYFYHTNNTIRGLRDQLEIQVEINKKLEEELTKINESTGGKNIVFDDEIEIITPRDEKNPVLTKDDSYDKLTLSPEMKN